MLNPYLLMISVLYILRLNTTIYLRSFSAGRKKYIAFSNKSAYWTNNKWNSFTKTFLKTAVKHLITECYSTIGDIVLLQIIGIPIGIDPAPFWANLYLYKYELQFHFRSNTFQQK